METLGGRAVSYERGTPAINPKLQVFMRPEQRFLIVGEGIPATFAGRIDYRSLFRTPLRTGDEREHKSCVRESMCASVSACDKDRDTESARARASEREIKREHAKKRERHRESSQWKGVPVQKVVGRFSGSPERLEGSSPHDC